MSHKRPVRACRARTVTAGIALVLAVVLVGEVAAYADPPPGVGDADPDRRSAPEVAVPVSTETRADSVTSRRPKAPEKLAPPKAEWPAAGRARVKVPSAKSGDGFTPAGATPWSVGDPTTKAALATGAEPRKGAAAPSAVTVDVAPQRAAAALGLAGVVARVSSDGPEAPGPVAVQLDYSTFVQAYGGDWSSRLRFVLLPDCALSTPERAECRVAQPLPSTNSGSGAALTTVVDLAAPDPTPPAAGKAVAPTVGASPATSASNASASIGSAVWQAAAVGDGGVTLGAVAAPEGEGGDWGSTPLSESATWSGGGSGGAATWSYPLRVPSVPGGLAPNLVIDYNSGSVDGRTASKNNQASWVGEGFELAPGFVERRYVPCADDTDDDQDLTGTKGQEPNNVTHETGDLCWRTANAVLNFAGSSDELVPAGEDRWRKRFDDGSRIRLLKDADNGAYNGEHWELTAPNGTRYYFGRGNINGQDTESAWTVPVFGNHPGEPGYDSDFADSVIEDGDDRRTAWRWNLDYVVDLHGNAAAYTWNRETNKYGLNGDTSAATYTRGGVLSRVDYGFRDSQAGTPAADAAAQVVFAVTERCNTAASATCASADIAEHPEWWPDVPGDFLCTASTCGDEHVVPTFFSRKRLDSVTTKVRRGSGWAEVDTWKLGHSFVSYPGEAGTSTLWPATVSHTGKADAATSAAEVPLPDVQLEPVKLQNRVDGTDLAQAMTRPRLAAVYSGTGAILSFDYATPGAKCTSASVGGKDRYNNTAPCFPVRYAYPGATTATWNWFHKYVVTKVTQQDNLTTSDPVITTYEYDGEPAWAYDDSVLTKRKDRTWNQWRGYETVRTVTGNGTSPIQGHTAPKLETESTYYRGLYGTKKEAGDDPDDPGYDAEAAAGNTRTDTVTSRQIDGSGAGTEADTTVKDYARFVGMTRQVITYDGANEISLRVSVPWQGPATAQAPDAQGGAIARLAGNAATHTFTKLESGDWRHGSVRNTGRDTYGYVVESVDDSDLGDSDTADTLCTTTSYVRDTGDTGRWILDRVATSKTVSGGCAGTTVTSSVRNYYDGHTLSATPTGGLLTRVEAAKDVEGGGTTFGRIAETTYDSYGRPLTVSDALDRVTTTAYRHNGDGLLDQITVTAPDPDGGGGVTVKTVTTIDPLLGAPTLIVEPSGNTTRATYDALGRVTAVWQDGRVTSTTPDIAITYLLRGTGGPNAVTTKTRVDDEDNKERTLTSIELFDGLLRPRQTQTELAKDETYLEGGRLLTLTRYDSRGLPVQRQGPAFSDTPVGTTLRDFTDGAPAPGRTETVYDGAGRPTKSTFIAFDEATTDPEDGEVIPGTGELLSLATTTAYGGDRVTVTPPVGAVKTTTITDGRGRTTDRQQHGPEVLTTSYTYSPAGHLATMTDPASDTWTYAYDLRGNRVTSTDPDHGTTHATFDDAGQQVTTTDAEGRTLLTAYDALGRRVSLREGSAGGPVRAQWAYDTGTSASGTAWTKPGLPSSSTRDLTPGAAGGDLVTKVTGYDAGDRPTGTATAVPTISGVIEDAVAGTYTTTAAYNEDGSLESSTAGNYGPIKGEKLSYGYDTNGRPEYLTGAGSYVSDVIRAPYGQALRYGYGNTWANAAWERLRYQPGTRRVTDTWLDREAVPTTDDHTTYAYDPAGNPLEVVTDRDLDAALPGADETQCFTYDALRQLTSAWTPAAGTCTGGQAGVTLGGPAPYAAAWTFDNANGNRATQTTRTGGPTPTATTSSSYSYFPGTHRLASVATTATGTAVAGTDTYTYDANGNTETRAVTASTAPAAQTLTWDVEGKLDTVTSATGQNEKNYYDADGTRIIRRTSVTPSSPTSETTTLFLGDTELTLNRTTSALTWNRHYTFDGRTVATRDGNTMSDLQILLADAHNTATYAIEAATSTLLTRRTLPYGATRGTTTSGWASTRGFVDGVLDLLTGLTDIGARQYDPNTGRFASVDPVLDPADPQQVNGYSYANNNPLAYSDPTGLKVCGDDTCSIYVDPNGKVAGVGYENGIYVGQQPVTTSGSTSAGRYDPSQPYNPAAGINNHGGQTPNGLGELRGQATWAATWTGLTQLAKVALIDPADCTNGSAGTCALGVASVLPWFKGLKAGKLLDDVADAAKRAPQAITASTRVAPWAGSSLSRLSKEGETMYRVWGGGADQVGGWLTPIRPASSIAARQGLALPAENAAMYVSKVTLPAGVRMQVGSAGSAFGQPGGWAQAQVLDRIPSSSFGKGEWLP